MGRTQGSEITYVNIRDNEETGKTKFFIDGAEFSGIDGEIVGIQTQKKDIVPKKGENAGKTITVKNLLVDIVDHDGSMQLQVSLYSSLARNIINSLAGPDPLERVYFSVYKNAKGFRCISIRKSEKKDDYYTPYYNWEQELAMVETKIVQGDEKKDYDKITDKYVAELIPIIEQKIANNGQQAESNEDHDDDNDDLPF